MSSDVFAAVQKRWGRIRRVQGGQGAEQKI